MIPFFINLVVLVQHINLVFFCSQVIHINSESCSICREKPSVCKQGLNDFYLLQLFPAFEDEVNLVLRAVLRLYDDTLAHRSDYGLAICKSKELCLKTDWSDNCENVTFLNLSREFSSRLNGFVYLNDFDFAKLTLQRSKLLIGHLVSRKP